MSSRELEQASTDPHQPEITIGPLPGGITAAVWTSMVYNKEQQPQKARSITLPPRKYRDANGNTHESRSYRVDNIPTLIFALQMALEYCYLHPIYGDGTHDSDIPI